MKTKLFFAVICLIVFCSWTIQQKNDIKKAFWLIGTWENKTSKGTVYETWAKISAKEFSGKSYLLKGKDTVIFETVRLVQEHNTLFYIPTVKNQNDNLPVRFALRTISNRQMVFENPQHDFPQVISYTKNRTDSLIAEISGIKNGKERKETFPMKRLK